LRSIKLKKRARPTRKIKTKTKIRIQKGTRTRTRVRARTKKGMRGPRQTYPSLHPHLLLRLIGSSRSIDRRDAFFR
jgi:hypothetical protein